MFHKGIAGKREGLLCSYEKKMDEIYTGEIHSFAKCTRPNIATVPLGLLPDHVVFYRSRRN